MIVSLLAQQIVVLFIMMACGYSLVKFGVLKSEDSRVLSRLSVYLVLPCSILKAFQIEYTPEVAGGFLLAVLAALLLHILLFILGAIFQKTLHLDAVEKTSIMYSNAGNIIIPLVTAILGGEWVIYASGFMCVQLFFLWTHAQSLMMGSAHVNLKKIVTNPNLIAIGVGLVLFFAKIKLPTIASNAVNSLASIIGPLSMLMTGMLLAAVDFKKVFTNGRIYLLTLLRMVVCPGVAVAFLKFSGLANLVPGGETILLVSLLATTTPCASTVTQLALLHNRDANYASAINALTTLVSIVTMPLMVWLYQL